MIAKLQIRLDIMELRSDLVDRGVSRSLSLSAVSWRATAAGSPESSGKTATSGGTLLLVGWILVVAPPIAFAATPPMAERITAEQRYC